LGCIKGRAASRKVIIFSYLATRCEFKASSPLGT
jgi:hypothetical protein